MEKTFKILGKTVSLKMFNIEPKQNTNSEMKNFERLSAILGREINAESVLTADDMEKIEAAQAGTLSPDANAEDIEKTAEVAAAQMTDSVKEAVTSAIAPIQSSITDLSDRLAKVEAGPGAETTTTSPTAGAAAESSEPWNDPNRSYNKLA